MASFRAFIAIDLSKEARAVLHEVSETLAPQAPDGAVKWVQPSHMHLTLHFLGNTPEDKLDDLKAALDHVAAGRQPFNLMLDALGCFPNERRPRVIWVGLQGQLEALQAMHKALGDALRPLGWEPEGRPYHPHLTLGRVKDKRAEIDLPWGQGVAPAETRVAEVILYESQLRRQGPRYIPRHTSALASKADGAA